MSKQSTPILLLLLFFITGLAAQTRQYQPEPARKVTAKNFFLEALEERAVGDTLLPEAFYDTCSLDLLAYLIGGTWGYVAGMNGYGDLEKAQLIENYTNTAITINETWALFNSAGVGNNGDLRMKVYDVDNGFPGTELGVSDDIKVEDIDVDPEDILVTVFPFANPVTLDNSSFILSVDFTDLYTSQDSVDILQTDIGCGDGAIVYELYPDNSWNTFLDVYSETEDFDVALALFAVIEFEETSSVDDPFYHQGKMRLFPAAPNPASNSVRINFELEESGPVQVEIFSPDGRRLKNINLGQLASGRYTEEVDLTDFTAGAYVYSIKTGEARVLSRFVVK